MKVVAERTLELAKLEPVALKVASDGLKDDLDWLWLPETFRAMRHRNYRLFWTGVFTSNIGNWIQNVAQGYLVYQLTNSPFMVGLVSFANSLPILLFSLAGGLLADRLEKRKVLLLTQSVMMACILIMSLLTFGAMINIWHIIALSSIIGTATAFNAPSYMSLTSELVGREDLTNAIALNSTQFNLSRLIGPTIAVLLAAAVGLAGCFLVNGLSYLAVIASLLILRIPAVAKPKLATGSALANLREGFSYLRQHPDLLTLVGMAGMLTIFAFPYAALMPVMARDVLHQGIGGQGWLMTSMGVGATAGALTLARMSDYPNKGRLAVLGFFTFSVALFAFSQSQEMWFSMLALVVQGGGMITFMANGNTILQSTVPGELRGRVLSIWTLCNMGLVPFGSIQAGAVAENFGAPAALGVGAIVCFVFVALIATFRPQMWQLRIIQER